MKKYLFVFTVLATLATTACDTSSKASTTQPLTTTTAPVAEAQPQLANQPTVVSDSAMLMMRKKSDFKKKNVDMMRQAPEPVKATGN